MPEWKWVENELNSYREDTDKFVLDSDRATEQLQDIHRSNFYRALNCGGDQWEIPIVGNVGKSTFGDHYIRKCREVWPGEANPNAKEFLPMLRACHTIRIVPPSGLLFAENNPDYSKVQIRMIELICDFFDRNFEARPRALDPKRVESMEVYLGSF